ncbi:MAG: hypothetical protein JRE23_07105 [Deltaproteobacteria bacterium]|nr:hypothetical protein [Deltaproteobacteria bacterium]
MPKEAEGIERPVRVSIYLYPWMIRRIEKIAKGRGLRKRHVIMQAVQRFIFAEEQRRQDVEQ